MKKFICFLDGVVKVTVCSLFLVWPIFCIVESLGYHIELIDCVTIGVNFVLIHVIFKIFDLFLDEKGGE